MSPWDDALFVWREFIDDSGQIGINCAIFRNESHHTSSEMILEAEQLARSKWGWQRLYTYIDPTEISSPNPGYCFKCAGWRHCGYTRAGQHVLEKARG